MSGTELVGQFQGSVLPLRIGQDGTPVSPKTRKLTVTKIVLRKAS